MKIGMHFQQGQEDSAFGRIAEKGARLRRRPLLHRKSRAEVVTGVSKSV
jgi:hypothetical protein